MSYVSSIARKLDGFKYSASDFLDHFQIVFWFGLNSQLSHWAYIYVRNPYVTTPLQKPSETWFYLSSPNLFLYCFELALDASFALLQHALKILPAQFNDVPADDASWNNLPNLSYQPELLLLIWETALTGSRPSHTTIQILKGRPLGRLTTSSGVLIIPCKSNVGYKGIVAMYIKGIIQGANYLNTIFRLSQ